jgi:cellulose synthase/poly-beta-1,6-N-acetylglucosamine synthase-like glycosyltransferase
MKLHPFLAIYFLFYTLNFQNGSEAVNTKKQSRTPPNKNKNKKQKKQQKENPTTPMVFILQKNICHPKLKRDI